MRLIVALMNLLTSAQKLHKHMEDVFMSKTYHELVYDLFLENNPYYRDKVVSWDVHGKHTIRIRVSNGDTLEYNGSSDNLRIVPEPKVKISDGDIRKSFACKLVVRMRDTGHTQQTLSEYTGISQQSISNYIKAISTPSLTAALKIAEVLQCDLKDLLG